MTKDAIAAQAVSLSFDADRLRRDLERDGYTSKAAAALRAVSAKAMEAARLLLQGKAAA